MNISKNCFLYFNRFRRAPRPPPRQGLRRLQPGGEDDPPHVRALRLGRGVQLALRDQAPARVHQQPVDSGLPHVHQGHSAGESVNNCDSEFFTARDYGFLCTAQQLFEQCMQLRFLKAQGESVPKLKIIVEEIDTNL